MNCPSSKRAGLDAKLKSRVIEVLGQDKALHAVYYLQDLGLTEFPLNATGKVLRKELVKAVMLHDRGQ